MIDAARSPELVAALIALKRTNRELRNGINRLARARMNPVWRDTLAGYAWRKMDTLVLTKGARVQVGAKSVRLIAASSTRPLSGGLIPAFEWAGVEYGMTDRVRTYPVRSPKGTPYRLTRVAGRQFGARQKPGRVVDPATGEATRELVGIWVKTVVDGFRAFAEVSGSR